MGKSQYNIQFGGLPVGIHEFEFVLDQTFFNITEDNDVERATLNVDVILTKQNNLLQAEVNINGTVGIACDRCLKDFDFPIEASEKLVIKHGDPEESNDEILVIPEGQDEFDLAHYLYEYIMVSLPARRVPCELDAEQFVCDKEVIEKLDAHISQSSEPIEPNTPMWEQLKKIKFN